MNIYPLQGVYSYYLPETRKVVDEVAKNFPHETLLRSINPGLDDYHFDVMETYESVFQNYLPALSRYEYKYCTNGSSEGIFHILTYIKTYYGDKTLYIHRGEYQGYEAYGKNIGLTFVEVEDWGSFDQYDPGIVFLSNPSAIDGNIIDNEYIQKIADYGHKIVYDITYMGMTKQHTFDISHPNILYVVASLSKPYGLYYFRIGFVRSRCNTKTLNPNKWFKNIMCLDIAKSMLVKYGSIKLYDIYKKKQLKSLSLLKKHMGIEVKPSDVFLLGYQDMKEVDVSKQEILKKYKRNISYRFCLTPYFLSLEDGIDEEYYYAPNNS